MTRARALAAIEKITKQGAQEKSYSCGAASVVYALQALGVEVDEATVRRLSETDKDGADEYQLGTALEEIGIPYHDERDASYEHLAQELGQGNPCVLCVDEWDHWVAALGTLGQSILLRDPEDGSVLVMDRAELTARWRGPDDTLYMLCLES